MSTPAYTISDILTNILNAIQSIIGEFASVVAQNASTIATVLVIGTLVVAVARLGSRVFRGVSGWLRGLF